MSQQVVDSNITEKLYKNDGNAEVLSQIGTETKYVLDIGCGAGDNSRKLFERGVICDGITLSESEAVVARQFQENTLIFNLENGLPTDLPQGRKYDAIICSHVLEHICYPQQLLNDLKDRMHSDSKLIIALPNLMHYRYRTKIALGRFEYTETGIMDYTHFRWYTFESAVKLLEDHGFRLEKIWAKSHMENTPGIKHAPKFMKRAIVNTALWVSKGFFGYEMLFVAKKR
jgi:cyclopropane fatty-acyl-phospholipid synthase-like methyltransferase